MQEEFSSDGIIEMAHGMLILSESMQETGEYQQALEFIGQAEAIFQSVGNISYASCMLNRADIYTQLGQTEDAQKEYEAHVKILGKYIEDKKPDAADADRFTSEMLYSVERLGRLYFQQKNFEQAIKFLTTTNEIYLQLYNRNPLHRIYYRSYINSFEILGDVLLATKKFDEAHTCYKNFHERMEALVKETEADNELQFDLARALGKMGSIYMETSRFDLALLHYKRAIRHLRTYWNSFSHLAEVQKEYALLLVNAGVVYLALEKNKAAKKCFRAGENMLSALSERFPENIWFREIHTISLNRMGDLFAASHLYDDALECYEECLRFRLELSVIKPELVQLKTGLAVVYQHIGDVYRARQQLDVALLHYTDFYKQTCAILEFRPAYPDQRRLHAIAMGRLAMIHNLKGEHPLALQYQEKCLQLGKDLCREFPLQAQYKDDLAIVFQDLAQTYLHLSESRKAMYCLLKYYRLSASLASQYPENIQYRKGVRVSAEVLGGLYMSIGKENEGLHFLEIFKQLQP